jgi:hypothetical protein
VPSLSGDTAAAIAPAAILAAVHDFVRRSFGFPVSKPRRLPFSELCEVITV